MGATLPTEDQRIAKARQVLTETTTGHEDYGTAVGQLLELRHVLAGVLNVVEEGTERDRVNVELLDVLGAVKRSLDVKVAEAERLTAIEQAVTRIERLQRREVEILGRAIEEGRSGE